MAELCLQLGNANNRQEEFAEADRFYEKGAREAEES
jgi:hypothetical protein